MKKGSHNDARKAAQKLFRKWCKQEDVCVDAALSASLITMIATAIINAQYLPDNAEAAE
jgi:hypothetical protein